MSDLVERLLFHGRYGGESNDEMALRKKREREAAAARITELEAALAEAEGRVIADVVKWLRGQAQAGDKALLQAVEGSQLRRDLAAGVVAINRAATALETGQWEK